MFPTSLFITGLFLLPTIITLDLDLLVKFNHNGVLVGTNLESKSGRRIRSFLGIPYAKPPSGDLRFEAPVPYPPWEGLRSATKEGNVCPQIDQMAGGAEIGNEDCLFLNIYTPALDVVNKTGSLPVMVWFHGGGWIMGSGNRDNYGPEFFLDHDIILVTGNYRLGSLGFLSTETAQYPGNNALKDQLEILTWVKEHIHVFGGNPDSVTIFGESAGSHSVSNHLQSPLSKGYFHRAIQQSGVVFNAAAYPARKGKLAQNTLKLAKNLKCHVEGEDLTKSIARLKNVDVSEILKEELTFYEWMYYPICPFQPVLEVKHPKAFIDEFPREIGVNSLNIPVMMGIVSDEGLLGSAAIIANEDLNDSFKKEVKDKYPIMFGFDHLNNELQEEIKSEIDSFYFKDGHNYDLENHQNLTNLFSDAFFVSGFDEYLERRLSKKSADTYVYILDHKPAESLTNWIGGGNESLGVTHGDDLGMLFPNLSGKYSEKDVLMREAMVKMWVNFATHGNPTPPGSYSKWKPTTKYPWNYVRLGSRDLDNWYILENEEEFARDRMEFWKKVNLMISEGEKH